MVYTVKALSKLSNVSVRTLHFYEEAGLLHPAYYGSNGYRYYGEGELLQLQQILFFKQLGFSLKDIQKILQQSDFNRLTALHSHKKALNRELQKLEQLIETVDNTINYLNGKEKMDDREFFAGFTLVTKRKGDESYYEAEELLLKNLKQQKVERKPSLITLQANKLFQKVADCLENGLKPPSEEVQKLIRKHHSFIEQFHNGSKDVYLALAKLYQEHPDFRKQLISIHENLPNYISKAMILFADEEL